MKSNIRLFAKELDVYIRKYHDLYSTSSMSVEDSERLAYIEEVFLCVTKKLVSSGLLREIFPEIVSEIFFNVEKK